MQSPTIELFSMAENFQYLWLKYVTGFDLTKHCARCLLGSYSGYFWAAPAKRVIKDVTLNEKPAKYYYLCGVTSPYRYSDNLHLAFRYKPGSVVTYDDGKTKVTIRDAERIEIKRLENYTREPGGLRSEFYTCRNWMFAYQMTYGLENGGGVVPML